MMDPMLNARWVRERRIEVVAPVATLQTELGEWTLRGGVVPDDVPVREVLRGRVTVDGAPGADRGRARRPLRRRRARAARAGVGGRRPVAGGLGADGAGRQCAPARRPMAMQRGEDGVWRVRGEPSWRDAEYAFDVDGRVVTDPYSRRADHQLDALRAGRAAAARRLAEAAADPRRRRLDLRAAHPRLLDRRRDRAAPSTAGPTSRSRTIPPACATCGRWPRRA